MMQMAKYCGRISINNTSISSWKTLDGRILVHQEVWYDGTKTNKYGERQPDGSTVWGMSGTEFDKSMYLCND